MHGRKRESKEVKYAEARVAARRKKAKLYAALSRECFARRRARRYDPESLALCAKLLELNCELYSLWNYRKEYLEPRLDGVDGVDGGDGGEGGGESREDLVRAELKLIEVALQKNPKSYCTWQHRRWLVSHPAGLVDLDRELALCDLLLSADARNFHCWSYRRFIAARNGKGPTAELDFTTTKVHQNFSNYSAWHNRSAILPRIAATDGDDVGWAHRLVSEFDLVRQAFYTEPEDQSAWLYHRWLVSKQQELLRGDGNAEGADAAAASTSRDDGLGGAAWDNVLAQEVQMCRDLLAIEPDSKWPMLTLARLLCVRGGRSANEGDGEAGAGADADANEVRDILHRLASLDPMRKGYYADAITAME